MRFLLILIAVSIVAFYLRLLLKKPAPLKKSKPGSTEKMIPCKQCKLHIPINEAIQKNGNHFCCEAHYSEWQAKPNQHRSND